MDHLKIIDKVKNGEIAPIYFLQSEEPFFIDQITQYLEKNLLDEAARDFNQVVLYGKEVDYKQVLDQAMQFPMMSTHRLVIIKEAQEMRSLKMLESYMEKPNPSTVLVIAHKHKKFAKTARKFWTALKKNAEILDAKKIYDNKVPGYIKSIAQEAALKINPRNAQILADHTGNNLSKIANEINKLKLNIPDNEEITIDHIHKYVGINKDFNVFELQSAIGKRDKLKAYRIVKYFSDNPKSNPIQANIGALYSYFTKLLLAKKYSKSVKSTLASKIGTSPYFVDDYLRAAANFKFAELHQAINSLHVMDKSSKGINVRQSKDLAIYHDFLYVVLNG